MAYTFTPSSVNTSNFVVGDHRLVTGYLTPDSSYATGGEALTAGVLGLTTIESVQVGAVEPAGGVSVRYVWDATNSKLKAYYQGMQYITKTAAAASMTDSGTTGTIDFATGSLPANTIPISSEFNCTVAFSGDTSAVWKLGVSGTLDAFSATTTNSCFTAIKTGSNVTAATAMVGSDAARTPRLTVTTGSDFTTVYNAATATGVAKLNYLYPANTEVTATTDLSALVIPITAFGR